MIMAVKQFASGYGGFLCPNLYTLDFIICLGKTIIKNYNNNVAYNYMLADFNISSVKRR